MGETQLSKDFMAAATRWLNTKLGPDNAQAVEVTSWDEDSYSYGGCPTCDPGTEIEVTVYYKDETDRSRYYTYYGKFAYILTDILNA